jgi:hypothetical protein
VVLGRDFLSCNYFYVRPTGAKNVDQVRGEHFFVFRFNEVISQNYLVP